MVPDLCSSLYRSVDLEMWGMILTWYIPVWCRNDNYIWTGNRPTLSDDMLPNGHTAKITRLSKALTFLLIAVFAVDYFIPATSEYLALVPGRLVIYT